MTRSLRAFVVALALILALTCAGSALAQIDSYSALLEAVSQAHDGDVLIISGVICPHESDQPLRSDASIVIRGAEDSPARLVGVRIDSMTVGFSNVEFSQGLEIQGNSRVQLMSGTRADGASGLSAITMTGSGTLQIDRDSVVTGGANAGNQGGDGVTLLAENGPLQVVIEGEVAGGEGRTGGNALTLSGLKDDSIVTIGGTLLGTLVIAILKGGMNAVALPQTQQKIILGVVLLISLITFQIIAERDLKAKGRARMEAAAAERAAKMAKQG